jgi:hypothetical protein
MQLRFLRITGPDVPPAEVAFGPGLNVIYGGSNTGKSHIMRLVDFVLGAGRPPEPIAEQARYDFAHLGVIMGSGEEKTLVRALAGGNIRVLNGLRNDNPSPKEGTVLSAKHAANSISMFLLDDIGAAGARLRTDAKGETKELSYRDFKPHILIDEAKVQSEQSPIQGGQVFNRTRELSVFKYMLTGVDDSALDYAKPEKGFVEKQAAQLELLDRQIEEVDRTIQGRGTDPEELENVDANLDEQIIDQFRVQEQTEATYQRLSTQRNLIRLQLDQASDRAREIDLLQARFRLLLQHYDADIERLEGIIDAGHVYDAEPEGRCAVCGAAPEHHDRTQTCEGDVPAIIEAANAELKEVTRRRAGLVGTAKELLAGKGRGGGRLARDAGTAARADCGYPARGPKRFHRAVGYARAGRASRRYPRRARVGSSKGRTRGTAGADRGQPWLRRYHAYRGYPARRRHARRVLPSR